jgi:acyl-CoA reductase-like NAD-dependent aldehyde dehydrogenase
VTERAYDGFLAALKEKVAPLRAGESYGHITMPSQVDIIRAHIADALAKGGTAISGGHVEGTLVEPTVLVDVPEDSAAVQEETFGPTLTVTKVKDVDEAVRRTNATRYGLAGAVFSKTRGMEIARRIRAGMVSVNAIQTFASVPSLPFGGVGESGFGRIHGEDGLREFTWAKATTSQRMRPPLKIQTFTRTAATDARVMRLVRMLYGRP